MRTAVTLCRVPEAAAGPFVLHDALAIGFEKAARHGFDAVELFLPAPDAVPISDIMALQDRHGLAIAAVGTGAGMVKHGLSLTDPDPAQRAAALDFVLAIIDLGGQLGAPAILGSMQGKHQPGARDEALAHLAAALRAAGSAAEKHGVPFLYEPLNRYETNLFNQLAPAAEFLAAHNLSNIRLLADLFHMAIEETDLADSLRQAAPHIGHIHWADSNRRAIGLGHTDPAPIAAALREISYTGYLSAEVFPLPDADTAATRTLASIKSAFS